MLAESIGLDGTWRRVDVEPFPSLAILDTEEILEKIGEEWKIPEPFGRYKSSIEMFAEHDRKRFGAKCDVIFTEWIGFCDGATKGIENARKLLEKGQMSLDYRSSVYASLFSDALPGESNLQETVSGVRNAFIKLLSPETQKKFNFEEPQKEPSKETRTKIDNLVKQMGIFGIAHFNDLNTQLEEFDKGY